jgi:hypothetical protein
MIGRTVASNRRFAEFGDSIMFGPLDIEFGPRYKNVSLPRHEKSASVVLPLYFSSHRSSKLYPQHECLQSHLKSVTFLLSSHIWQQNFLPSVQMQEQLACPHFLGSGMAVSLRRNSCSIRAVRMVPSCLHRRGFNAIARAAVTAVFAADVALKGRGCFEGVDRIEGTGLL